jgi:hypothetical protein
MCERIVRCRHCGWQIEVDRWGRQTVCGCDPGCPECGEVVFRGKEGEKCQACKHGKPVCGSNAKTTRLPIAAPGRPLVEPHRSTSRKQRGFSPSTTMNIPRFRSP